MEISLFPASCLDFGKVGNSASKTPPCIKKLRRYQYIQRTSGYIKSRVAFMILT